jgi:hypothetical protein
MRFNLILFVLVLVLEIRILWGTRDEDDNEVRLCNHVWNFTKITLDFMKFHTSAASGQKNDQFNQKKLQFCNK